MAVNVTVKGTVSVTTWEFVYVVPFDPDQLLNV